MILINRLVNIDTRSPLRVVVLHLGERRFAVRVSTRTEHPPHSLLLHRIESVPILVNRLLLHLLPLPPLPPAEGGDVGPPDVRLMMSVTPCSPWLLSPNSYRIANNLETILWLLLDTWFLAPDPSAPAGYVMKCNGVSHFSGQHQPIVTNSLHPNINQFYDNQQHQERSSLLLPWDWVTNLTVRKVEVTIGGSENMSTLELDYIE